MPGVASKCERCRMALHAHRCTHTGARAPTLHYVCRCDCTMHGCVLPRCMAATKPVSASALRSHVCGMRLTAAGATLAAGPCCTVASACPTGCPPTMLCCTRHCRWFSAHAPRAVEPSSIVERLLGASFTGCASFLIFQLAGRVVHVCLLPRCPWRIIGLVFASICKMVVEF